MGTLTIGCSECVLTYGVREETVYMRQPPGFIDPQFLHAVCKLQKALYGLKQAPRAWFARLSSKLQSMGFIPSHVDTSLFTLRDGSTTVFILIYVDDIIVTGSSCLVVQWLLHSLSTAFAVKDLGALHYFLDIQVTP